MSKSFYVCPLCGQEFALKTRQKNVKCGNHVLRVAEENGLLTIQVISSKTKQKGNVSDARSTL